MTSSTLTLALAVFVVRGGIAFADPDAKATFDPDFHFIFLACHITGSSLGEPSSQNDGFTQMKTGVHHTACERVGKKKLSCVTVFDDENAKPAVYDMNVTTDSSQVLIIESANASDFLVVRPQTGRVVSTTRIVDTKFLATKTCHGVFMTGDEFKAFEERERNSKTKK